MKQLFSIINLWGLILLTSSCSTEGKNNYQAPLVKINTVKKLAEQYEVSYPGIIEPADHVSLAFKVSGQLVYVLDTEGTSVKKGTLIASLDAHDYEVQLVAAEAAYRQAKKEFARMTELNEAKTVSPNDFEKAQAAFKQVEAKYQSAKDAVTYTELRAPFDGYIHNIYHYGKEIIQAGVPIVGFISTNRYKAEINIPVQDYKKQISRKGAKLLIGNQQTDIQVEAISKHANANQLYKMRFSIPQIQSADLLTAGMNCSVILIYEKEQMSSVKIPVSAIREIDRNSYVWKVTSDMKVDAVPVTILKIEPTGAIVTGLKDNDQIVVTGIHELTEGQTVEKMPSASVTNIGNML